MLQTVMEKIKADLILLENSNRHSEFQEPAEFLTLKIQNHNLPKKSHSSHYLL
jgi:hypothetical protein